MILPSLRKRQTTAANHNRILINVNFAINKNTIMKKCFLLISAVLLFNNIQAQQNDPIILTVAGEQVTRSEFVAVYQKNNIKGEDMNRESIEEYMELFINYKLKVKEAESLGMDTLTSFKNELAGYRKQLAQPYLSNREVTDQLMAEAYNRMQFDIRASHILIKVSPNASPADTLAAYNKIMGIRNRILKGEDFSNMAVLYSDDKSAQDRPVKNGQGIKKGNKGDLGYFSALDLLYEFENAAYSTNIGEVSMPVRTMFGYHLIKVTDKRPAIGQVQVAQILIKVNEDDSDSAKAAAAKRAIDIYNQLMNGANFEDLAREQSDDKGSGAKGGVLPWFRCFRMIPEFMVPVYDMKPGDVSKPILTSLGWHIIRFLDRKPIGTFEEVKSDLKMKISRDARSYKAKDKLISRLKLEYNFTYNDKSLREFIPVLTDSIYTNAWTIAEARNLNKTLCTIDGIAINQQEFALYLEKHQDGIKKGDDKYTYLKNAFNNFTEIKILEYENTRLEEKYADFRALMKEYRDGILLFNLMDQKVWSAAVKDTSGLNAFYETIKGNYLTPEKIEATIFTISNPKLTSKLYKMVLKAGKKNLTPETIAAQFNKDSVAVVRFETNRYENGQNPLITSIEWKEGVYNKSVESGLQQILWVHKIIAPEPKPLQEVKGVVTALYQEYLEAKWVEELRSKYTWEVNRSVMESLYTH